MGEWLQTGLSVLLGGLIGGGVAWRVTVSEWRRNRRTDALERFYVVSQEALTSLDPYAKPRRSTDGLFDRAYHAYSMLRLYAPSTISDAARKVTWLLYQHEADANDPEVQQERRAGIEETKAYWRQEKKENPHNDLSLVGYVDDAMDYDGAIQSAEIAVEDMDKFMNLAELVYAYEDAMRNNLGLPPAVRAAMDEFGLRRITMPASSKKP